MMEKLLMCEMQFSWISSVPCVFGRLIYAELSRRLVVWNASDFPRTLRVVLRRRFRNLTAVLVDHLIAKSSAEDGHEFFGKFLSTIHAAKVFGCSHPNSGVRYEWWCFGGVSSILSN